VRYEVAVQTPIALYTQRLRLERPPPEDVIIEFEGRRFVWHATHFGPEGEECWPTITTLVENSNDYAPERVAMERFLSAVSFYFGEGLEVVNTGGAGWPGEMDPPVARSARSGDIRHLHEASLELVTDGDERLTRVMGYYRDGHATASPFYRFLAFYNALDVACEDFDGGLPAWIRMQAGRHAYHWGNEEPPVDLWTYVQDENRHAVAHAVRHDPGLPELDPNDPVARGRFHRDSQLLADLVKDRVRERWGPMPYGRVVGHSMRKRAVGRANERETAGPADCGYSGTRPQDSSPQRNSRLKFRCRSSS
jgi:hypothetical protein